VISHLDPRPNFCHNKMYKADIIKDNNISFKSGMKLGEDAVFLADYLSCCKSFNKVREPRYHYVPDEKSAVHRYREEFWPWEEKVIQLQWDLFHKYPLSEFEEHAMERWLYEKLKYAAYYYCNREKNKAKRKAMLKEIYNSDLFKRLLNSKLKKGHKHLRKNDRKIIRCWKMFGVTGIRMTFYVKTHR